MCSDVPLNDFYVKSNNFTMSKLHCENSNANLAPLEEQLNRVDNDVCAYLENDLGYLSPFNIIKV